MRGSCVGRGSVLRVKRSPRRDIRTLGVFVGLAGVGVFSGLAGVGVAAVVLVVAEHCWLLVRIRKYEKRGVGMISRMSRVLMALVAVVLVVCGVVYGVVWGERCWQLEILKP